MGLESIALLSGQDRQGYGGALDALGSPGRGDHLEDVGVVGLGRDQQPQPGLVADQRASGLQGRGVDALPVRRRDERRTDVSKRLLAEGGLLLSADQAGHPGHDEDEQEGRRDRDDPQVGRFLAEQLDGANGLRDQRRGSQEDQTRSGQARLLVRSAIGKMPHGRVERGRTPQEVEHPPSGLEEA
jgi:hypothetical protein